MFAALMLGLTMLTNVTYAQQAISIKSLNNFVITKIGFPNIEVNDSLPNFILQKINKEDWSDVKSKISQLSEDERIKFRKLDFSDHYGLDIDFFYSSYTTNFEINIYVRSDDEASNMKSAIKNISSYAIKLMKDLSLLNTETTYGAFILFDNINVDALDAVLKIEDNNFLLAKVLHQQACFIASELDKSERAKAKIKEIVLDDQLTEQVQIEKVVKILKKKDLYKGELKLFLSIDTDPVVDRLKDILSMQPDDCVEPLEENFSSIMEYYQLLTHFHDFVSRLDTDRYSYVLMQTQESAQESYYKESDFTLHLNIEDLFYKKADLPKR